MKLSEKQAHALLQIAIGSTRLYDNDGTIFPFDNTSRQRLVAEILNQQDDTVVDLDTPTLKRI
jgi:hypothetical protein